MVLLFLRGPLPQALSHDDAHPQSKRISAMVLGTCRWFSALEQFSRHYLDKPIKHPRLRLLAYIGLYQCLFMHQHAALSVHQTVEACRTLKLSWAKSMLNFLLRSALRHPPRLQDYRTETWAHPAWLDKRLQEAWPHHIDAIRRNSLSTAAIHLRCAVDSRDAWVLTFQKQGIAATNHPHCPSAIIISESVDITSLPGFHEGQWMYKTRCPMGCTLLVLKKSSRMMHAAAWVVNYLLTYQPAYLLAIDTCETSYATP